MVSRDTQAIHETANISIEELDFSKKGLVDAYREFMQGTGRRQSVQRPPFDRKEYEPGRMYSKRSDTASGCLALLWPEHPLAVDKIVTVARLERWQNSGYNRNTLAELLGNARARSKARRNKNIKNIKDTKSTKNISRTKTLEYLRGVAQDARAFQNAITLTELADIMALSKSGVVNYLKRMDAPCNYKYISHGTQRQKHRIFTKEEAEQIIREYFSG